MTIKHIETIYLGCKDDGTIAEPDKSHIVRFCWNTSHAHATIMSLLSNALCTAQTLADEKITDQPYRISILWPLDLSFKRKPENSESAYQILNWWIKHMMPPTNGAIISIYKTNHQRPWFATPWRIGEFWPMEKQWKPKGQYITIHKVERLMSRFRKPLTEDLENKLEPVILEYASKIGYDVKYIDYSMTMDDIYHTLLGSDHHFSYCGGTYYFTATLNVPTTSWGTLDSIPEMKYNCYDINGNERHVKTQSYQWGKLSLNPANIRQYDHGNKCIVLKPAEYQKVICNKDELIDVFNRIMNQ